MTAFSALSANGIESSIVFLKLGSYFASPTPTPISPAVAPVAMMATFPKAPDFFPVLDDWQRTGHPLLSCGSIREGGQRSQHQHRPSTTLS